MKTVEIDNRRGSADKEILSNYYFENAKTLENFQFLVGSISWSVSKIENFREHAYTKISKGYTFVGCRSVENGLTCATFDSSCRISVNMNFMELAIFCKITLDFALANIL